jgi:glutathione synthase/RimK-type ligase-like ATP-grasp enzyme
VTVLCLSYPSDPHLQAVLAKCEDADVAVFWPPTYPQKQKLSYTWQNKGNDDLLITLLDGTTIESSQITSVYWRRLRDTGLPEEDDTSFEAYNKTMSRPLIRAFEYAMPTAKWLSTPTSIVEADNKILQLMRANSLGFNLPPTYIGNDAKDARDFVNCHNGDFIVKQTDHYDKPLYVKRWYGKQELKFSFTSKKFTKAQLLTHLPHLANAPAIVQTYVPKKTELRITVVGDKIFPCSINAQNSELGKVDWRYYDMDNTLHEAYTLPTDVEQKCFALVKELGLNFGCIDMVVTPDDEHVFLEINPNGQWLWIENLLPELTISQAIADFLTTP